ncbi:flagellar basal body P-ring formation chaperone FlgA [Imhoffiella purpurea]|uniref:Flagella basal body P-ring formation protein FlgA n=1 Tax=Imhoffiella purpurea TaxID=1249627 RepID=W9W2V9_9GAMM|nr:flagellar basal body P-ring formation chaperone FlgA [Imhoffiella purpurea]EXJ16900.1 Flagellar basal-body P-ring formation protein FlgA [Imhoffiella purpurea]
MRIDTHQPQRTLIHRIARLLFIVMTALPLSVVAENQIEPLERIIEAAHAFLTQTLATDRDADTRIEIGRLDSRLRLHRCAHTPTAQMAPGGRTSGSTTVNVRCSSPVSWSIFVPVTIERYADAVVVARPISSRQTIQRDDLRIERTEMTMLAGGYFSDLESVVGLQTRRSLTPGQVVLPGHLTQPRLVERGQLVTLYATRPGLSVHMKGIALEDGREGERIRVRNRSSKRIVEGIVDARGEVHIGM